MMQESNYKHYIKPNWRAPNNIKAFTTTRNGANYNDPYGNFNLAEHVNDKPKSVLIHRQTLTQELKLPTPPFWLEQIHSTKVVMYNKQYLTKKIKADASYTNKTNQICTVMTADCLPILFCNNQGSWVAATHAGWRGLLNGIVENTIQQYQGKSSDLMAWLGPSISQRNFEVGEEVKQQFITVNTQFEQAFIAQTNGKYLCDLYLIARLILQTFNVEVIGGDYCTYEQQETFYSYRRDGETGRMASLIWIEQEVELHG